jgi:biotin carboxyl carrier protein
MYKAKINDKTFQLSEDGNEFIIDGKIVQADILEYKNGKFHVILNQRSYSAEVLNFDKDSKTCVVNIGSSKITVQLKDKYDDLLQQIGIDESNGKKVNDIKAPMPGMVLHVMVEKGQPIKKGDAIVVLEAMKMENILKSPVDGIINRIHVTKGDKVEKNQVMVNLD